jgi:HTH-type transcriptional regulator/antitoxin HipB
MLNGIFKNALRVIQNSCKTMKPVILRQARESAGLTQEEMARRLRTKKSAISRIENHADDVRLSTLRRYADAIGANRQIRLAHS